MCSSDLTQPLNAISPIDQKFFELIVPIATFLTGTLSGIMLAGNDKEAQREAMKAANKGWERPPTPVVVEKSTGNMPLGNGPTFTPGLSTTPAVVPAQFAPAVTTGFGGKEAPVQPPHPEI